MGRMEANREKETIFQHFSNIIGLQLDEYHKMECLYRNIVTGAYI